MATMLGIKQNTYSKIESGTIKIKTGRVEEIAKILDVDIEFIINESKPLFSVDEIKKTTDRTSLQIEKMENMVRMLQYEIYILKKT